MPKGKKVTPVPFGFHGTHKDLNEVVPPSEHGEGTLHDDSGHDLTYFALNEPEAWNYATQNAHLGGRPRVYVTRPVGDQHVDSSNPSDFLFEDQMEEAGPRVAARQEIVDTRWAPPPTRLKNAVVHQTLPHINWDQFGAPNWTQTYTWQGQPMARTDAGFESPTSVQEKSKPYPKTEVPGQGVLPL